MLTVVVLCVSGTSDERGNAPAWFVHTRIGVFVEILGRCFMTITFDTMCLTLFLWMNVLKMKNYFENLRCYKLVSEPWFKGFGCIFGRIWTQTKDLRKNLDNEVKLLKREKRVLRQTEQSRVYDQPAPERWIPKSTLTLCVMRYVMLCMLE